MIPLHLKDQEYFDSYPAPIMRMLQEKHFTNCNSTIAFFSPMFYFLLRALKCEKVLELGMAEGYSSFYLASAIKDNAIRNNYKNAMFYGIDICQTEKTKANLDKAELPNTIINLDTINLTNETFKDIQFDLIFQDACHAKINVLNELAILYPQLKGNGLGYWIAHDVLGPASEGFQEIKRLIDNKVYDFQYTILDDGIYGLAILRKMEDYVERKYPS